MYLKIRLQWLEKLKVATQRTFIQPLKWNRPPGAAWNTVKGPFMLGGRGTLSANPRTCIDNLRHKVIKNSVHAFSFTPHFLCVYVLKTRYFINEFSWKKQSTVLLGFNQVTDPPKQYFWKRYVKLQLQRTVNRKRNLFLTKYYAK